MSDRYDTHDRYGHLVPQNGVEVTSENGVTRVRKVREEAEARHAKYLLWLDTYNAALTGLLANAATDDMVLGEIHDTASKIAGLRHGEQS